MSKYKENIPMQFVINKINTLSISKLMPVAKIVCGTDYAVAYYQNKNHPQFYHNQDALRKALRRCFSIGAFNHREIIIQKLNLEYEYMREQVEKYSQIVEGNQDEIIKLVNNNFEENKEYIKTKILKEIRVYIEDGDCVHYEWKRGDCPYDSSGILVANGTIDLHQTIYEFLNEEYCGRTTASFESGCGLYYDTYGNLLSETTMELGENIMYQVMYKYIQNKNNDLSDDLIEEIICETHDLIYDNTFTCDFFFWEGAIAFCNIGEIYLCDILN